MTSRQPSPLKTVLHPYIFVLKEGGKIKKNLLDYSLMMLYIHSRETIHSPVKDNPLMNKIKIQKNTTTGKAKTTPSLQMPPQK